jgi:prophage maintenance system killer protein
MNNKKINNNDVSELISGFSSAWLLLDAYDKESFPKTGTTKRQVKMTADDVYGVLLKLKEGLTAKNEVSRIFGQERQKDSVKGIVGNIFQSFGKKDLYPTLEEKAAHFLYFMVKNHPFVDGNKRIGAFIFVWFLRKFKILNISKLTPEVLAVLTLFVAGSNPKDKERITGLILMLLKK